MLQEGALSLQLLFWLGLAFTAVFWVRPMFHRRKRTPIREANEAETLTEILPNQLGRVLYEGSSWQACCENYQETIATGQKVYVLRREGNILFVAPRELFEL